MDPNNTIIISGLYSITNIVYFHVQIFSHLARGKPFRLVSVSFWRVFIIFLEKFPIFWHGWAYLVFSLTQPWRHPFLLDSVVYFCREWFVDTKIWTLSVLTATELMLLLAFQGTYG